jgi:pyridoxine 4-dehydrogenase
MTSHWPAPDHRGMEPQRHILGPVRAVELGVDRIDTAEYYGPGVANELIRAALPPYAAGLAVVSKVGARRDASGGVIDDDPPGRYFTPAQVALAWVG